MPNQIEDKALQQQLITQIEKTRRLNQIVGNRRIRLKIDEYLTRAYLLARDGNESALNGGKNE